ncbi:pentatricopeptide repeat-containing protein [Prunus yedoensis var. nudiflora]|uniref:Pentatricopeptide repeat-containing protein n=1 Tax=Prunus yedoensis var. nudiflora TaxID=2094558 RepID=A0A315AVP1_PRUYE|nr:pentatricopeptide repeat-containing protein [Prunus yedoensis var. nudiflora]
MFFSLRNLSKSRASTNYHYVFSFLNANGFVSSGPCSPSSYCFSPSAAFSTTSTACLIQAKDVVLSFKEWFKSRNDELIDRIFQILKTTGDDNTVLDLDNSNGVSFHYHHRSSADLALAQLNLRLSETFVLEVLRYGSSGHDVLSCLKFFDWVGRQHGFNHTRATFNAIFKILSRAKLMSLMLDFLSTYRKQRYAHCVRFHDTLVMGYAVAGKPDIALQLFGKMRFQGLDLDVFAYHVLLNALVEENCFDAVQVIAKQISLRGFENEITHSIMLKWYCKQNLLDDAEKYLRKMLSDGRAVNGHAVSVLVDALCKNNKFEQAGKLVEEFQGAGVELMESAYGVWIRDLVHAGRLLREDRLEEVCDLLMEMKDGQICPDKVTMNAALCFFCKAGMVDIALELYNSKSEFGFSPSSMAYNYLINTFCGDGSVDEAYRVLKNSMEQDALCREGKLDKMKELVIFALERNFMPSGSTYDKFITTLCRTKRVEDGYLIHGELNRINKVARKSTYFNLIHGFNQSSRGDIAARLLIEMQEKGHSPTRNLAAVVLSGT